MDASCCEFKKLMSQVLSDLKYMSNQVIKKTDILLNEVESLNVNSVDALSQSIITLFERINLNITDFSTTFNNALVKYKKAEEIKKSESTEADPNLAFPTEKEEKIQVDEDELPEMAAPVPAEKTDIEVVKIKEERDDSDLDEPTLLNFDVPVDSKANELKKALDELCSQEVKKEVTNDLFDSTSFDFDDMNDQLVAEMEKGETHQEEAQQKDDTTKKENKELLVLLTKITEESNDVGATRCEDDVNDALQILEDEVSVSGSSISLTEELEEFILSEDENPDNETKPAKLEDDKDLTLMNEKNEQEEESKIEDIFNKEQNDDTSDAAIDRLTNISALKRKPKKSLSSRRKKLKRIRILGTSSSSSDEEPSSDGSTTPDLNIDDVPSFDFDPPEAIGDLADDLANKLDREDEISLDSDTTDVEKQPEEEEKKKRKRAPKKEEIVETKSTESESSDVIVPKKLHSWRNDPLLRSSSSGSDSDSLEFDLRKKRTRKNDGKKIDEIGEIENLISDDEITNDKTDEEKKELKQTSKSLETMVITDTAESTSDDDDVLFVESTPKEDEGGSKGRRNIRSILHDNELNVLTQKAKSEEDARILRLEEHSKTIESIQSQHEEFILDVDAITGEPLITVDKTLTEMLKPHQKSGVQFMWDACYETVETLKTNPGSGCILAHCMGLGKTLQVITLIHTLLTHPVTNTKHVLVVCPLSTVINWNSEFKKTFKHFATPPNIIRYSIVKGDITNKISVIHTWRQTGGVLILGYDAFQIITNVKTAGRISATERQRVVEALINPGPDLIVCDEGHQLKNGRTQKTQALMKVKTKRRIVLTGTPLQNNLTEYYFMVQFVKPHLLGDYKEYMNMFATPIQNGQFHDSTPTDIKRMKKRTHVLTRRLKKTVHRVEASVLAQYLPEITDYALLIKLTPLQEMLYTKYIDMVTNQTSNLGAIFFHDNRITNYCNLHPYALHLYYSKPKPKKKKPGQPEPAENPVKDDWYKELFPDDVATNINYSSKLKLIIEIINEATCKDEKVLVFAQHLVDFDVIEHFLKQQDSNEWKLNVNYFRMDGETAVENRNVLCKKFNTDPEAKVFLLTHKVGGLGLNLTGANRVILIGSNHNPSHDNQSLYRVYRFGQKKNCYVYRLLSLGTMEEKIYHRCVMKLSLSGTVVDKLHFDRHYRATDLREMYKYDFTKYNDRPIPALPSDKLMAKLLTVCPDIYSYHLHDALLENRPEEELTDEDKKLAWEEFSNLEEAAKLATNNAHTVIQPPKNPLKELTIYPANESYPYNRFGQFCGPRNNAPNLVPNPFNTHSKGYHLRQDGHTPNKMANSINRFLYNPMGVVAGPSGMSRQNTSNNQNIAGSSRLPDDNRNSSHDFNQKTVAPRGSSVIVPNRPQTASTSNLLDKTLDKLKQNKPNDQAFQKLLDAINTAQKGNATESETASSGEFNYTLNKLI